MKVLFLLISSLLIHDCLTISDSFRSKFARRRNVILKRLLQKSKRMNCRCGIARVGKEIHRNQISDEQVRIVDGYEPKHRPWMAYLQIASDLDDANIGICGGSIINKKWILSAGHCFCIKTPCKKDSNGATVIDFDPRRKVRVVVGLKDIATLGRYPESMYTPDKIVIHPDYFPKINDNHDLALVRLEKEIDFNRKVMPICLPYGPRFPDVERASKVYVAGWGAVHDMKCTTNEFGPQPNTKCKFPFKFKSITFTGCISMPSPSSYDEVCKKLKRMEYRSKTFPDPGVINVEVLEKERKNLLAKCFNQTKGEHGWCGTCIESAQAPGEEGYCGPGATNDDDEAVNVEGLANWGFCNRHCIIQDPLTNILQEVCLDIVPPRICKKLGANMNISVAVEMCAGKKIEGKTIAYFALKDNKDTINKFEQLESQTNKKFGTTYGGQDACTGDSGGPLWKWLGNRRKRAFIIGVVSRGKGCARKDAPGIYARVKKYLNWIFDVSGEDRCHR